MTNKHMEVFELEFSVDDFTSLYLPDKEEEKQFKEEIENRIVACQPVNDIWQNFIVLPEEVKKRTDFFEISGSSAIVLSQKAMTVFSPFLNSDEIELLPFTSDEQTYYLLNIKSFTKGAINIENSELELIAANLIASFETLIFNPEQLENKCIFVVPELPYQVFITDIFRNIYIENNLTGLELSYNSDPVWYDFSR